MLWARRALTIAFVALLLVITNSAARANGRFPEAQQIVSVPGDGKTLFLRTTFGILVSRDGGEHWRWICERALGYEGEWDPPIAATRDGRLWVGLDHGLVSTRDACEVEVSSEVDGHAIRDLTTDARGETVWAVSGVGGKTSYVWRRAPGKAFERLAAVEDTNLMTIEVAPSAPSRVYVTGQPWGTIRGFILRSNDGGKTLAIVNGAAPDAGAPAKADAGGPLRAATLAASGPLFIGAVDPDDPNRVVFRHLHAEGSDLYLSKDGGKTLTRVLSMKSAMFGFAKSRDHKTLWAGSGLPQDGIFRSTDRGEHFESIAHHGVLCLESAPDALFLCENGAGLGAPAIGVSADDGKTVRSLARFADIEGPETCPTPDARASLCEEAWPKIRALVTPRDADAGIEDGGVDAGSDAPRRTSSCHCRVAGVEPGASAYTWGALLLLLSTMCARWIRGSKLTQPR